MKLHRRLGISYNAAWRMKHKLMQAMMEQDHGKKLSGFIELDDACLGGERTGGKRGRGAAGKTPFVAAVETTKEGNPTRVKLSVVSYRSFPNVIDFMFARATASGFQRIGFSRL